MDKKKAGRNKLAETFAEFENYLRYIYGDDECESLDSDMKARLESKNDEVRNQMLLLLLAQSATKGAFAKEYEKVSNEAYENIRLMYHYRYEFYVRGNEQDENKLHFYKYLASEKGAKQFKDSINTIKYETLQFQYSPALTLEENLFNLKVFSTAAELYLIFINRGIYDDATNDTDENIRLLLGQIRNKDYRLTMTSKQRFEKWQRYIDAYDMSQANTLADVHDKLHSKDKRTHIIEESKPGCVWSDVEYAKKLILAAEKGTFPEID